MRFETPLTIIVLLCFCQEVYMKLRRGGLLNRLHHLGIKPVGREISSPKPEMDQFLLPPSGRRHMQNCEPKPFPDEEKPILIELPKHIDDNMYYATTARSYFTAGAIPPQGYHPPTTSPPDACEQMYEEHVQKQYSNSESELTKSEESIEFIRKALNIKQ